MLFFFTGTDREKTRAAIQKEISRIAKKDKASVLRITDAHAPADLAAALQGSGMFGGTRVLVFEGVLLNEEMRPHLLEALPHLSESAEPVFIYEERPDAAIRKVLEKYAENSERFDAAKKVEDKTAFSLAYALQKGDRKALWVGYMRELSKGSAPEMIHGILFWGAKTAFLRAGSGTAARERAATLVSSLAELPHASRRRGFELEYALEHFLLSSA